MADRCNRYTLGGSRCELAEGHEGKHSLTFSSGGKFAWTDEGQNRLADEWGSRFD